MNPNFDFVGKRKGFYKFTIILLAICLISILFRGLNLGVDFTSGTRIDVSTVDLIKEAEIVEVLKENNISYEKITFGTSGESKTTTLLLPSEVTKEEVRIAQTFFEEDKKGSVTVSVVSPQVGKELVENAMRSLLLASIGIMIYLAIRFEWLKGVATLIGVLHNILIMIGIFSIFQVEVSITFIAAILTVVGYSINDTIVTFDRIRENMRGKEDSDFDTFEKISKVTNDSLNQTLNRSINTVLTVLFAAVSLLLLGSSAIFTFSLALVIGLIAGGYSSIFIAAQIWVAMKHKQIQKRIANPVSTYKDDNDWV